MAFKIIAVPCLLYTSLLAHNDVTAVAALPHLDRAFGEDLRRLYIVQQGTVALLMVLFNCLLYTSRCV